MTPVKSKSLIIRMRPEMHEKLRQQAHDTRISMNTIVTRLLDERFTDERRTETD